MKIIYLGRGSGKTTELIKDARFIIDPIILCCNLAECRRVERLSIEILGNKIKTISFDNIETMHQFLRGKKGTLLIDDSNNLIELILKAYFDNRFDIGAIVLNSF